MQNVELIARSKSVQDMTTAGRGSAEIRGVKTTALHKPPGRGSANETRGRLKKVKEKSGEEEEED